MPLFNKKKRLSGLDVSGGSETFTSLHILRTPSAEPKVII